MISKTKTIISVICVCIVYSIVIFMMGCKIISLQDKVKYYENVITDFGIEEFIHYPELYYEEGFVEQAMVHNCMWSIDETLSCHNELAEIKETYGITECPQDGYENCNN